MNDFERTQGYILLHRKLLDKDFCQDSEYFHLWVYILLKANHKDKFFNGILIRRGSFLTGRKRLAEETGINESKVERILNYLESEQQIEQQKSKQNRVIVVLNYEQYQKNEQQNEQQKSTGEQQKTLLINDINDINKDIISPQSSQSSDFVDNVDSLKGQEEVIPPPTGDLGSPIDEFLAISKRLMDNPIEGLTPARASIVEKSEYNPMFELFWALYPARKGKKVGKSTAFKIFSALKKEDKELAIKGVERFSDSNPEYPKDPERWLKGKGWVDEFSN